MVGNRKEYEKMYRVETEHWWYRLLHMQVSSQIQKYFGSNKNIRVLDAGCGTGGTMQHLQNLGYKDLKGFDVSPDAIEFTTKRGFDVQLGNLNNLSPYDNERFDVIIALDNLHYIEREEQSNFFKEAQKLLNPNGLIIVNFPALDAFKGVSSDQCFDIKERYDKNLLRKLVKGADQLSELELSYWPFILSIGIWLVRTLEKLKHLFYSEVQLSSDSALPFPLLNRLLFLIGKIDLKLIPFKPFGSSLFGVFGKQSGWFHLFYAA